MSPPFGDRPPCANLLAAADRGRFSNTLHCKQVFRALHQPQFVGPPSHPGHSASDTRWQELLQTADRHQLVKAALGGTTATVVVHDHAEQKLQAQLGGSGVGSCFKAIDVLLWFGVAPKC